MKEKYTGTFLEKVMKNSPDILCILDEDGEIVEISEASKALLGYDRHEVAGKAFTNFLHPEDSLPINEKLQALAKGEGKLLFKSRHMHKTGKSMLFSWSAAWSEEDRMFYCNGRQAEEEEAVQQEVHKSKELHKALGEQGFDMIGLLDQEGNFLYVGGATTRALGYEPEQLIGKNAFSFLHPDDVAKVREAWVQLDSVEALQLSEVRFRTAAGEWRWLESHLSNQLLNPKIGAIVVNSRDISEHKFIRQNLEESQQRFKSLFDNNPAMIVLENTEGICLDINRALESVTSIPKEKFINQPMAPFLPATIVPVYESAFKQVLKGETVRFEVEVEFKRIGRRILDISKVPVMVNGELSGVFTIANDITAISDSNRIIKEQARRLSTIFESITDAFFTLDKNWCFTFINREFDRILQTNREELLGENVWDVFPEEINGIFYKEYKKAIETGTSGHFEAYLGRLRIWLEVKVYPSEEGLAIYFTDITRRVNAQEELQKLSVVAEKSHSGIVITDKGGRVEWVNESASQISEFAANELLGQPAMKLLKLHSNLGSDTKEAIRNLDAGESFEKELPFETKSGKNLWLKVGATPVMNPVGAPFRYIFMFTDISLQKKAIEERNRFIQELQSRNQSLSQFSHVVSHQLRSPVANILGLSSLFNLPEVDEGTRAEVVERLGTAAKNLDSIIKDLSRVLSLREPFGHERISILFEEVLEEVMLCMKEYVKEQQVEIRCSFEEAPSVYTVKPYLQDVLFRLLSNAIKFRSSHRKALIEISSTIEGDCIVLYVKDNGIGVDLEKHKENIFGLYKRFHQHKEGRGLGLYLVKNQAEALGGKVEVQSKVGEGSVFKVFLRK